MPLFITALFILYVPGYCLFSICGVRPTGSLILAPTGTLLMVGLTTTVSGFVPIQFGWILFGIVVLFIFCIVVLLKYIFSRFFLASKAGSEEKDIPFKFNSNLSIYFGALIASISITFISLCILIITPKNLGQGPDTSFHINTVRWILDTGKAYPPFAQLWKFPSRKSAYYPDDWHATVALITDVFGPDFIAQSTNVLAIICGAVVWTVGMSFFAKQVFGKKYFPVALTTVFSVTFLTFPYLSLTHGTTYPNFLSICLIPYALGCFVGVIDNQEGTLLTGWKAVGSYFIVLGALGFVHPAGFVTALLFSFVIAFPKVVKLAYHGIKFKQNNKWVLIVISYIMLLTGFVVLWMKLTRTYPTQNRFDFSTATIDYLSGSSGFLPASIGINVLVVVGFVSMLFLGFGKFSKYIWVPICFLVSGFFYILGAALPGEEARSLLVGIWFGDLRRIACLYPIAAAFLATIGVLTIIRIVSLVGKIGNFGYKYVNTAKVAVISVILLVFVLFTLKPYLETSTWFRQNPQDKPQLYSTDGEKLMEDIKSIVPPDALIVNRSNDSSPLIYGLANRQVIDYGGIKKDITQDEITVLNGLTKAMDDPAVCAAIKKTNSKYAVVFDDTKSLNYWISRNTVKFPGFANLDSSPAVKLVAQRGEAKLYEINDCNT